MSMQRGVDLHAARDSNHALELLQDAENFSLREKPLWLGLVCCPLGSGA
ncbi:hypothetical protein LOF13_18855 [Klebsiella pneumoniae subsp. pneumoniae]|nr:hypothetical protein LOF13_18855 [Klebsiella pneumoniae subsp. pneumoniae]